MRMNSTAQHPTHYPDPGARLVASFHPAFRQWLPIIPSLGHLNLEHDTAPDTAVALVPRPAPGKRPPGPEAQDFGAGDPTCLSPLSGHRYHPP